MAHADHRYRLDQTLDRLETAILPDIADILAALWEAAGSARGPGGTDEIRLRTLAAQLESVTHQIEAISPTFHDPEIYRGVAFTDASNTSA